MAAPNQLIIMADEFAMNAMGCAKGGTGHSVVKTPNLDRLATRGARFTKAYTPSPMCVPARAAFQTGLHVHQLRKWDSAQPYDGAPTGWAHWLRAAGHRVVSAGKLHYRSSDDDNGFDPELLPLHVTGGQGWIPGLLRKNPLPFDASNFAGDAGRGGSSYSDYDRRICDASKNWIKNEGAAENGKPWVLFVSFVSPHYPINAPDAFFDLYDPEQIDMPFCYAAHERPKHPAVRRIIDGAGYDQHFRDEDHIRLARQAYYGLCSYVDHLVGELLETLEDCGFGDTTTVLFTADHGDMLGDHGTWTKMIMYEGSAGIPLILAGPGVPASRVVETPVSLIDIAPSALQCAGQDAPDGAELPGGSLYDLATAPDDQDRTAFSEYHDGWSDTGSFMVRWDRWKYVHYEGYDAPQLFDLVDDPQESRDLGEDPGFATIREEGARRLHTIVDPTVVNAQAFADQDALIEHYGGEQAIRKMQDLYFNYTPISDEAS
ncbi:MAG: sulfatase-like hydrolase/transferase [Alphaproteobacteria bacterium]|nr:sulfatase-like hydrolase/transferase [Alphaproteobacteria bacterium]